LAAKQALRLDRRAEQELMEKSFKDSTSTYNRFARKLMKARFTRNVLPKIRDMMAADVQGNLTLLDLGGGKEEEFAADIVNDKGFSGIKDISSMRFYITQRARSMILPPLHEHFTNVRAKLWKKLGTMRAHVKTSLISSVGAVPHVGQTLSASVPGTVDDVFGAIKHAVNASLEHVRNNVADKLIESIANPMMDVLSPKLRSDAALDSVDLPSAQVLASMAKQGKQLEVQSVLSNWANGLENARKKAALQEADVLKDAYSEAKLSLADVRSDNELAVEVLDTQL